MYEEPQKISSFFQLSKVSYVDGFTTQGKWHISFWLYFTTKHDKWHHSERQSSKNTIILAPSVVLVMISCLGCATSQALWPCAVDQFCQWQANCKCLWILHSFTCHYSGLAKICTEPFNKYPNYYLWQDKC